MISIHPANFLLFVFLVVIIVFTTYKLGQLLVRFENSIKQLDSLPEIKKDLEMVKDITSNLSSRVIALERISIYDCNTHNEDSK
jgi:Sec-independent protein translocase protein TatA